MRRVEVIAATLLALGIGLIGSSAVLAKGEYVTATFDAPLPVDPAPGSTVEVSWTLTTTADDGSVHRFTAEGIFLRLTSATGEPLEVPAHSDRDGHFSATVTVPSGGLGTVAIGLRGTACMADGSCTPSDEFFRLATKPASAPAAAAGAKAPAAAAGAPAVQPSAAAAPLTPAAVAPAPLTPAAGPASTATADLAPVVLLLIVGIALLGTALAVRGRGRPAAA